MDESWAPVNPPGAYYSISPRPSTGMAAHRRSQRAQHELDPPDLEFRQSQGVSSERESLLRRPTMMSGGSGGGSRRNVMIEQATRRSISSIVAVEAMQEMLNQVPPPDEKELLQQQDSHSSSVDDVVDDYGACAVSSGAVHENAANGRPDKQDAKNNLQSISEGKYHHQRRAPSEPKIASLWEQIPAIVIASLLNLMLAIPFGVAYFPIGWSADGQADSTAAGGGEDVDVHGPFPLPGKEALGIRMCLFSTLVGQIIMTFASKFTNPVCFQMVENVPFFHALATIAIAHAGYGMEALSTLFFLFGLSSVIVGVFFYLLGRLNLGRVVYFFPQHVLVGCIGGIGVFITRTAIEVTNNSPLTFDRVGWEGLINNLHLLGVVILFEATLRLLMWKTKSQYPLLSPIFFCSIPVIFYAVLFIFRVDIDAAQDAGYFFPNSTGEGDSISTSRMSLLGFNRHTFDLLRVVDFRTISWDAVLESIGTMVALAAFSLIHVPVNIPAFAVSMDKDTDMNAELMAHGYSNVAAGMFAGLPNYMTYSNSLLFAKSKGDGKVPSLLIAFLTLILFFIGPGIATYIPRCMAGTLLLHVGLDLVLEGVVDSYGSFDALEYSGIWLITIVMTVFGMTAGLIAGIVAALSIYIVQSIAYLNPISEVMTARTLRSSAWTRPAAELVILDDDLTGRARVLLIQLQGHLFFGNATQFADQVQELLRRKADDDDFPLILIFDFSLVVGLDSSAAHAVSKLNGTLHRRFLIKVTLFVTGSHRDGFPCEYALSEALSKRGGKSCSGEGPSDNLASIGYPDLRANIVCGSLDEALIIAEDVLISQVDPTLLKRDREAMESVGYLSLDDERRIAAQQLANLCPRSDEVTSAIRTLVSMMDREEFVDGQILWRQGDDSDCAKLLVRGELVACLEAKDRTYHAVERVPSGNIVGELGLVHGNHRLNTLECASAVAVCYNLSKANWEKLKNQNPSSALVLDEIVIRYLAQRVQHVTNRIVSDRRLPV